MPTCPRCGRTYDRQDKLNVGRVLGAFLTTDQTEHLVQLCEEYLAGPESLCPECLIVMMVNAS